MPEVVVSKRNFVGPGDQRTEQQLVVQQDHDRHREDHPADRADVALRHRLRRDRRRCPAASIVLLPTVIASDATTKNQPPDIDIIMFQMRPGIENGTSSCQKRCHVVRGKPRETSSRSRGHRAQRLVEAERHVPGLAREDREDRGQLGAQHAAGEQRHEERDRERKVAQHRHRLQDVEDRDQDIPARRLFAAQVA